MRRPWLMVGVVGTLLLVVSLVAVRFWGRSDFCRIGVPGYLTGIGTLGLATLTLVLMQREAEDRKRLEEGQRNLLMADATREARKVVILALRIAPNKLMEGGILSRDVIRVINAGTKPILDVKLISGLDATPDTPPYKWVGGNGLEPRYEPLLLPSANREFPGQ
jgi:hypothetical protein